MPKDLSENLNNVKKGPVRNDRYTKWNNNLHGINSRVDEAKTKISDLEYKEAKSTQLEEQKEERIQKNEDSVRSLWDNFKHTNIHIMGVPEGEETEQGIENVF